MCHEDIDFKWFNTLGSTILRYSFSVTIECKADCKQFFCYCLRQPGFT